MNVFNHVIRRIYNVQLESVKEKRYHFRPRNGGGRIGPPIVIINYRYGCDLVEFISAELTEGYSPRHKRIENGPNNTEIRLKSATEPFFYEVSA